MSTGDHVGGNYAPAVSPPGNESLPVPGEVWLQSSKLKGIDGRAPPGVEPAA